MHGFFLFFCKLSLDFELPIVLEDKELSSSAHLRKGERSFYFQNLLFVSNEIITKLSVNPLVLAMTCCFSEYLILLYYLHSVSLNISKKGGASKQ